MSQILVLSKQTLASILDLRTAVAAVEQAYIQKSARQASLIPMLYHALRAGADFDIKAGHMPKNQVYGLKLVSCFSHNREQGLPVMPGTTLLFDDANGQPLALLNAEGIDLLRVGAAGALGAKYLARPDSQRLLLVGTGAQAACQIAATLLVMPGIRQVQLYNPHGAEKAQARLPDITAQTAALLAGCGQTLGAAITVADDLPAAVGESDIIITATPSQTALIDAAWVRPGTHFSCIGADVKGKQELDPMILKHARVFADDIQQAIEIGECQTAINNGIMFQTEIAGEIGAVMAHTLAGRMDDAEVTVFDSTGIALQDLAVASAAYTLAVQKAVGVTVEL